MLNYRRYISNYIIYIFVEAHVERPCYTYVLHLLKQKIIDKRLFCCTLIDGDAHIIIAVIMMINKFIVTILQINNNSVINFSSLYQYIINITKYIINIK